LLFLSNRADAQPWEYGAWFGVANYFGDLNTNASFEFIGPATGFFVRYNINTRFAFRTGLNFGSIAFEDATSKNPYQLARNLSFSSNLFEWSNDIEFNFFKYDREKEQYSFTPFLLFGISAFYYKPQAEFEGEVYSLQPIGTERQNESDGSKKKYAKVGVAIPIGGGIKYSFSPFWAIGVEGGLRKTFSDYIDDVSTVYPGGLSDPLANSLSDRSSEVTDPPIGKEGKQRGFAENNDSYLFMGITISYWPHKVRCPKPAKIL